MFIFTFKVGVEVESFFNTRSRAANVAASQRNRLDYYRVPVLTCGQT
jgi:hypothetical protein